MKSILQKAGGLLLAILLPVVLATGCSSTVPAAGTSVSAAELQNLVSSSSVSLNDLSFTDRDLDGTWESTSATKIALSDAGITVNGAGATADGSILTIGEAGTYVLSGTLSDGQILVDSTADSKIQIVLNGVSVHCSDSAALYVAQADKVFLTVADGTENTVSSGDTYSASAVADEITGAIFSRDDLAINGTGSLTVEGKYKHGIVSTDDLILAGPALSVTAAGDGLRGKDCVKVASGTLTITAGGDGIQSSNDSDSSKGFIYLAGGTFAIDAAEDGIQAETLLCVTDGIFDLTTGGGSANADAKSSNGPGAAGDRWGTGTSQPTADSASPASDSSETAAAAEDVATSTKGMKAGTALVIAGGTFTIDSADDTIHSNGDAVLWGGTLTLSSGDDGIHADASLSVSGGTITVNQSYEGLEGTNLSISGGTINVTANDDGLNAADSSSNSGLSGDASVCSMTISGGTLRVNASGDGLDSNGDLTVTGGTVYVSGPTDSGNGALDYGDGASATISGGTVVAAGAAGMADTFGSESSQYSFLVYFDSTVAGGTEFKVTNSSGQTIVSDTPEKDYQCVVVSSPELKDGETYTVTAGSISVEVTLSGISTTSGDSSANTGRGFVAGGNKSSFPSGGGIPGQRAGGKGGPQDGNTPPSDTTTSATAKDSSGSAA